MTEEQRLRLHILAETGLFLDVESGMDQSGTHWYLLRPSGYSGNGAFGIRTTLGWRSIRVDFEPDTFAGGLLSSMGATDAIGRAAFQAVLRRCGNLGAVISFRVNDESCGISDEAGWPQDWKRVTISLRKSLEPVDNGNSLDFDEIADWTGKFAAAILALLPVQDEEDEQIPGARGHEEGAESIQRVTRYERDRRNRAAAIANWGSHCQACDFDFGLRYGDVAAGFIEVHHLTPVSTLEPGTVVDPARDLVPLCPNCHAVAHRRNPPFSVSEIRDMLQ